MDRVAALGCIICRRPAEIHHVKFGINNRDNMRVIPLCLYHHRAAPFGECIENGKRTFESKYATELELLEQVQQLLLKEDI